MAPSKFPAGKTKAAPRSPAPLQAAPARAPSQEAAAPFWRTKKMSEMSDREWESLCDGCGRCCLNKLTDEDTNEIVYTDVGCTLLDGHACRCSDYKNRQKKVSDCVRLTWRNVKRLSWLPPTCGYRLVANGQDLAWWHPLVSGSPDTVHEAGISVRDRVSAYEDTVPDDELVNYIVKWPGKWPKGAKGAKRPATVVTAGGKRV